MKPPAIALDVHRAFTPELRERIIDDIRVRSQEPFYRLLSPQQVHELARIDTGGPSLVSLYLQLTPERRVGRAWRSGFSALAHTISQIPDRKARTAVEDNIGQIERALSDQLPELGRGAASFVCGERGIWHQIALPIPLPDHLRVGTRPYLRPLLRCWGRYDRMLIALLSREQSRFLAIHLGNVEEIYLVRGQRIRGMLTDRVPRDSRDAVAIQVLKDEAKSLAAIAEVIGRELEASHILLSATPEMGAAFGDHLSKPWRERVNSFEAGIHASLAEIAAAAAPLQQQLGVRAQREGLERRREGGPEAVSTGTQETLDCLSEAGWSRQLSMTVARPPGGVAGNVGPYSKSLRQRAARAAERPSSTPSTTW